MSGYLTLPPLRMENAPAVVGATPQQGYLANFLQSALRAGTSEMVGLPGEWTGDVRANEDWRQQNFVGSLASQILGSAPAYVASSLLVPQVAAASGVARAVPGLARLFSAESLLARPMATTAGRAIVDTVPVAAGRLALTPMLGGDFERVAASSALDLAGAGLLGGAFGFVRGLRAGAYADDVEQALSARIADYNLSAPYQERLDALLAARPNFTDPDTGTLMDRTIDSLRFSIRNQPARRADIGPLEGQAGEEAVKLTRDNIGRLFTGSRSANSQLEVKTLTRSSSGFPDNAWEGEIAQLGLPQNWETTLQYPRWVRAKSAEEAARVQTNIRHHLEGVGDGWFVRREANQDLFVVARKLRGGDKPAPDDVWFVARTNAPARFIPGSVAMRKSDRLARFVGGLEDDVLARLAKGMPDGYVLKDNQAMFEAWSPRLRLEKPKWDLLDLFPEPLKEAAKEFAPLAQQVGTKFRGIAAPAMAQFKNQPLASWVFSQARATFETAQGAARSKLYGDLLEEGNPAKQILKGLRSTQGLRGHFEALREEDMKHLVDLWARARRGQALDERLAEGLAGLDPAQKTRIETFYRELVKTQDATFAELQATEKAVGVPVTPAEENYDFPHMWAGQWRQRVFDEKGKLVFMGAGQTKHQAHAVAKQMAERNGWRLDPDGPFMPDKEADWQESLQLFRAQREYKESFSPTKPGALERRLANPIGGFVGDDLLPVPKKSEIWSVLENDIRTKYQNLASHIVTRRYQQQFLPEVLARYGKEVGNQLVKRLNDMVGRQTEFSRWQNRAMKPLDAVMGKNSATRIAATANAFETHMNLFVGNMGYVAANAVTFVQTVAPKIALMRQMIARGETDRAFALFDFAPDIGPTGAQGVMASLSPWKLAKAAFGDLLHPSETHRKLFLRAVREGAVAPKMYDDYLGETARISTSVRGMMQGEEPVQNLIRTAAGVNSLVPVKVEELTRAHAFMTGARVAEVLGLGPEATYQFAKQFTYRTMYGYSQADRPRMFTGPAGMMFGLFKNWMFHYLSDWGMYGREALRGNYQGLLWATAGTAAIGGAGGVPLYGLVDTAQKWFTNKPLMEELYAGTGVQGGDALFYGLPGLLGLSLQASAAAPLNDPVRDVTFLFNVASLERAQRVGKLLGEAWNQWAVGGMNPLENDRTWDLAAYALGPRTLYKLFAQIEDGSLKSIRNGRPIIEGIGGMEAGLNAIGLSSTRIARAWEISDTLWKDQEGRRARTSAASDTYFQAMLAQDAAGMSNVLARAMESGVDVSGMMQGVMLRQRNQLLPQMPFDYLRMPGAAARLQTMGLQ